MNAPQHAAPPDDANDLRGFYFKLLLARPLTQALVAAAAIVGGLAGAVIVGPAIGGATFFAGLAIALLVAFAIADSRSEDAFFDFYAAQRGMSASGKRRLAPLTPLLRKGDDRYAERVLDGPLGDGVEGLLALYTYEERSTDGDGHQQTDYYRYTIATAEIPESARFVADLACQRKSGPQALDKIGDAFRRKQRIELESEALLDRYEIFAGANHDPNWLRQLFSPTFIVWLTESAPDKFAFELVAGALCCYVKGHAKRADELDEVRNATAAVATRLREEALE